MSIVLPLTWTVLPAPIKFNVRTVPIATPPDWIPTTGSESISCILPVLPNTFVTFAVLEPAKPICLTWIDTVFPGAVWKTSELDPVPVTLYALVFVLSDGYWTTPFNATNILLLSIPIFAFYISSYPNVDITDFFIYLAIYLIIPLTFAALSPKNHEEKNQSSNGVNKTEQNYEEKIEDESFSFFLVIADIMKYTILILVILFLFLSFASLVLAMVFDSLFSGGCYGVCGLSGWGGP